MSEPANQQPQQKWTPDKYVRALDGALEDYRKNHPHWQFEAMISVIRWALSGLKYHLEDSPDSSVSWDSPFIEMDYPIEWNFDGAPSAKESVEVRSRVVLGQITEENTLDKDKAAKTLAEIMVRRLTYDTLSNLTNGAWFEVSNNYYTPVLPIELDNELNAIKGKKERRDAYENTVRPFSIGAASLPYFENDFDTEGNISKEAAKKLARLTDLIDMEGLKITVNRGGEKIDMTLVFQIHPLIANYDTKQAYHPVGIGLFIEPKPAGKEWVRITPGSWTKNDRREMWRRFFEDIDNFTKSVISEAESQTSVIFTINAQVEIPIATSDPEARNAAIRKIMDNLALSGQLRDVSIRPGEPPTSSDSSPKEKVTTVEDKPPTSASEGVIRLIWNSKWRWPLIIAAALLALVGFIFSQMPESIKVKLFNRLGL